MDYSLNHDIMASFPLNSHPELPKSDPTSAVQQCKGALICLGTSLKGAKTLFRCPLWIREASKGVNQPQPWHHGIIPTSQSPRISISDPASAVLWCKGALICLRTSLKGEKTLYLCPKWRWEAIKGGHQPQPLHHGIISTRLSPRIAKIWPSFSCVVTV